MRIDNFGDRFYTALTHAEAFVRSLHARNADLEVCPIPYAPRDDFASNRISIPPTCANPSKPAQFRHGAARLPLPRLYELRTELCFPNEPVRDVGDRIFGICDSFNDTSRLSSLGVSSTSTTLLHTRTTLLDVLHGICVVQIARLHRTGRPSRGILLINREDGALFGSTNHRQGARQANPRCPYRGLAVFLRTSVMYDSRGQRSAACEHIRFPCKDVLVEPNPLTRHARRGLAKVQRRRQRQLSANRTVVQATQLAHDRV